MHPTKSEFPRTVEELPRVLLLKFILEDIQKVTGPSFQISQLNLLLVIMDQEGVSYPDIMRLTGLPASTISRNVKALAKGGLVEIIVDPDDTRCHAAKLTKNGGDLKRGIQLTLKGGFTGIPK